MRPQPLIAVTDVEASSRLYQRLLGCQSAHGGAEYERLVANGALILQLHSFAVEHHHGPIGDPDDRPYGNGVLLWFEIDDFDAAIRRVEELGAVIVMPRRVNRNARRWECWLRDPDGYGVVIASADGSASGWGVVRAAHLKPPVLGSTSTRPATSTHPPAPPRPARTCRQAEFGTRSRVVHTRHAVLAAVRRT